MVQSNIVWITIYDINLDLGCYLGVWLGVEYVVILNLDCLVVEGVCFD